MSRRKKVPQTPAEWLAFLIKEIAKRKSRNNFKKFSRDTALFGQSHTCRMCGNSLYMGEFLIVEFDHMDGNRSNNSGDNCQALCPKCHRYLTLRRKKYGF